MSPYPIPRSRLLQTVIMAALAFLVAMPAEAQTLAGDGDSASGAVGTAESEERIVEAQALFTAGQAAYDDARYEAALGYFQQAAALSPRPELQYNVGLAADRLRQDEVALDAFRVFLAGVDESHVKYNEVQARVRVLSGEVDLRVRQDPSPASEEAPRSRVGLAVGLSVAAVAIIVGVVLVVLFAGGEADPIPGNFGSTVEAVHNGTSW